MDRKTYDAAFATLCKIEALVDNAIKQLDQIEKEEKLNQ